MITKEHAKNLNARTQVKCSNCKKQYPLIEVVHEEPLPYPHRTAVEGFLLCPNCQLRTHSYYMTEYLRHEQEKLKKYLLRWHSEKSNIAYQKYEQTLKVYQKHYKAIQEKYKEIFGEGIADGTKV